MKKRLYRLSLAQIDTVLPTYLLSKQAREMNHLAICVTVKKNPDIEALKKSFNLLVKENDGLRLRCFLTIKGIRQYISDYEYIDIPVIHLNSENELQTQMRKNKIIDGIFSKKPLYKAIIFTYDNKATLFMAIHHICYDGFSMALTYKAIQEYYKKYSAGEEPELTTKKYTIEQYLQDDEKNFKSPKHKENIKFWKNMMNSRKDFKVLVPLIKSKSPVKAADVDVSNGMYFKAIEYCKKTMIPLSSFISSTAALAISEYTGKNDFCFFQMNHGRDTYLQKKTIGNMINSFLHFYHVDGKQLTSQFFKESYSNYLDCMKHSSISVFERIFCTLKTELRLLRANYYGVIFSLLSFADASTSDEFECSGLQQSYQPNQFYCMISDNYKDSIKLHITYQSKIISEQNMNVLKDKFLRILNTVLENDDRLLADIVDTKH